jgi:hypothetical protein
MMGMGGYNHQMKPLWSSWKENMHQIENIRVPPSHHLQQPRLSARRIKNLLVTLGTFLLHTRVVLHDFKRIYTNIPWVRCLLVPQKD